MAIENKNDKQIQDLLENNFPIKAIPIDFNDLNNRGLILKSSFPWAYEKTESFTDRDNWYFLAQLNGDHIDVIGVAQFFQNANNELALTHLEVNKIFRRQGKTKEILDYLKRFVKFRHFKNITVPCIEEYERHFLRNGFVKKGFDLEWTPEKS
jgi:hypothetical protein